MESATAFYAHLVILIENGDERLYTQLGEVPALYVGLVNVIGNKEGHSTQARRDACVPCSVSRGLHIPCALQ